MQDLGQLTISQQTIATLLQLAGQYALPAAALLRALYFGSKHRMPEGMTQIAAASAFSGLTALAANQQPDLGSMARELLGNSVFMAGLLSFVVFYLVRVTLGLVFDAIVGAVLGAGAWLVWVNVLGNTELRIGQIPIGVLGVEATPAVTLAADALTLPIVAVAGAVLFVLLRFAMRRLLGLLRLARVLLVVGVVLILGAGAVYLAQQTGLL